jgi:hypothetical protein
MLDYDRSGPPKTRALGRRGPTWNGRRCADGGVAKALAVLSLLAAPGIASDDHVNAPGAAPLPIFDAHLHYTGVDAAALSPAEIIEILDANQVPAAVVSGLPNSAVLRLSTAAPGRILPFLNVYGAGAGKADWMHDQTLPERMVEQLDAPGQRFRGIGELHIFEQDADSPVLMALADIAAERGLMMQIHGDAAVIDAVLARQPGLTLLWAHLGTEPRPDALAPVLARHPSLYADTSVRDGRFLDEQGRLKPQWRDFFMAHADRVLVGVDTFWTRRWKRFDEVTAEIRGWLRQLPPAVAAKLARGNAEALFGGDQAPRLSSNALAPDLSSSGPSLSDWTSLGGSASSVADRIALGVAAAR